MEFEIGDKVRIDAVVTTIDKIINRIHITTDEDVFASWVNPAVVTLVERPVKFEIGKLYKRKDRPSSGQQYMYLGDMRFYSYMSREVLVKQPTSEWLKILVPVEES